MIADNRDLYAGRLAGIAAAPLESRADFTETVARWEAWWRFEADRPLLAGVSNRDRGAGNEPVDMHKPFDLLEDPDAWLAASIRQMEARYFIDSAVPSMRIDFGPVLTAVFAGASLHFARRENTSWQDPLPDVYERPPLGSPDGNRWFEVYRALLERVPAYCAGKCLVSLPDLSAASDSLANLRGSEQLLMDLYDRPDDVHRVSSELVETWDAAFDLSYEKITAAGAGVTSWLHAWSSVPYTVPTCDFNAMLGPDHFIEFCLPYLEEQGRRAGRCLLHLDGYDAARHAPALAASAPITAVQFAPGAGSPGAVPQIPMLRELQEAGKPILVMCAVAEVPELVKSLDPRGLVLTPEDVRDEAQAQELEEIVRSR